MTQPEHEQQLLALRPRLSLPDTGSGALELFQNHTLRPLLKMLHQPLVTRMQYYLKKHHVKSAALNTEQRRAVVEQALRQDQAFRHSIAGMLIGHFTAGELAYFLTEEAALMRRIGDMAVQRLHSDLSAVFSET
jgi:hypothetical protein